MKQSRIFINEWLEWHPYQQTTAVDKYYTNLANRIYKILTKSPIANDLKVKEEDLRMLACCLTAYFEDVISEIGIWKAFTTECKRIYGKSLPFYDLQEEAYLEDETNEEDVRFLIWHHIQQTRDGSVVNPENPIIEVAAVLIHNLLIDEYNNAPENERLQAFLNPDNRYDTFFEYRELLQWFHYQCYFNAFNYRELEEVIDEEEEAWAEKEYTHTQCKIFQYSITVDLCFSSRNNMLSLTSPEWLSRIYGSEFQQAKCFEDVVRKEQSLYLFQKEEEGFVYVMDVRTEKELRIERSSMSDTNVLIPNQSYFVCILARYNTDWHQYGALLKVTEEDLLKLKAVFNEEDKQLEEAGKLYDTFMKKCNQVPFVIMRSHEEYLRFLQEDLNYTLQESELLLKKVPKECLLTPHREKGLIVCRAISSIKTSLNPFYDAKIAEEEAFNFYTKDGFCPFELICYLHDNDLLPDAGLKSLKGKEHGKKLIKENWDFFTRYFLQRCREKDLK